MTLLPRDEEFLFVSDLPRFAAFLPQGHPALALLLT
jgi:hypothetical protein